VLLPVLALECSRGSSKYLITRRGYTSGRIAEIWNLEDGCGGAHA
jgi:hypothetical protein